MEGVKILDSNIVHVFDEAVFVSLLLCSMIAVLFLVIMVSCYMSKEHGPMEWKIIVCIGLVAIAITGFVGICNLDKEEEFVEYKALISDQVDVKEFYERYEIIDKDGEVYTIRDRKAD